MPKKFDPPNYYNIKEIIKNWDDEKSYIIDSTKHYSLERGGTDVYLGYYVLVDKQSGKKYKFVDEGDYGFFALNDVILKIYELSGMDHQADPLNSYYEELAYEITKTNIHFKKKIVLVKLTPDIIIEEIKS